MKDSPIEIASEVQRVGLIRDNEELEQKGISPVTEEAVPYGAIGCLAYDGVRLRTSIFE
jgi:hypothetical protein